MIANVVGEQTPPYTTPTFVIAYEPSFISSVILSQKVVYALMMMESKPLESMVSTSKAQSTVSKAFLRSTNTT